MHGTKAGSEVDRKFLETCKQIHGAHPHYRGVPDAFIVKHYAGEVQYSAGKLGEANKDALDNDLLKIVKASSDKLLQHLFRKVEVVVAPVAEDGSGIGGSGGSRSGSNGKKGTAAATVPSAGTRIRQQCQLLVTALMECSPHYVRW